jgi:hypothetical protein
MPTRDPQTFSDEWVRAWNAHDVEAVLRICLHFDIVDVYRVSLINYPSQDGGPVNEVLRFDGDRIREGHGTHLQ